MLDLKKMSSLVKSLFGNLFSCKRKKVYLFPSCSCSLGSVSYSEEQSRHLKQLRCFTKFSLLLSTKSEVSSVKYQI